MHTTSRVPCTAASVKATATATGATSIENDWLARSGGAVLVICVIVQQQAARSEASGAGGFRLS